MSTPQPSERNLIFISYRRRDSPGQAHRLAERLRTLIGHDGVFIDVDTVPPGEPFNIVVTNALRRSAAILIVIGPKWLGEDPSSNRLSEPNDLVRFEIREALAVGVPILPVLVDGAEMPRPEAVPSDIVEFVTRQALPLRDPGFDRGFNDVVRFLGRVGALPGTPVGARRKTVMSVAWAVFQSAAVFFAFATVAAPLVSWRDLLVDTWLYWLFTAAGLSAVALVFAGNRTARWIAALALPITMVGALAASWLFPAIRIVGAHSWHTSGDVICDQFETDTREKRSVEGGRYQAPASRASYCQGEAFAGKHFEVHVRTGWMYRRSLKATIRPTALPSSAPPVRIGDIAVPKSLSTLPPFLEPNGLEASFHAVDGVPPAFVVLFACWYDGAISRPARVQISVDLQAESQTIIKTRDVFVVDW